MTEFSATLPPAPTDAGPDRDSHAARPRADDSNVHVWLAQNQPTEVRHGTILSRPGMSKPAAALEPLGSADQRVVPNIAHEPVMRLDGIMLQWLARIAEIAPYRSFQRRRLQLK